MFVYRGGGEFIPGIPAEDMTDEEFLERADAYAEGWPEGERAGVIEALRTSPLWEHVKDPPGRGKTTGEAPVPQAAAAAGKATSTAIAPPAGREGE